MVSIVSIEGTDCRLVELGKVADKTAGKVIRFGKVVGSFLIDILSVVGENRQCWEYSTRVPGYFDEFSHGNTGGSEDNFTKRIVSAQN